MKSNLKKNFIFNLIYQVFVLIIPLITAPYISRVLLPEGVGQYSFTNSLQSYFVLFAALGFGYYAQREIANKQDNKVEQTKIFWEVLMIRFFSVGLALIVNGALCFSNVYKDYTPLMWWWNLMIIAVEFDITFLFQGNEEFGKIVGRNVLVKVITIILIFLIIKKPEDIWIYVLLNSASTLIGNLSLWLYLPKYITKVPFSQLHPLHHLKPTIKLFIPTIATSIYLVLDKTLIGILIPGTYVQEVTKIIDGVEVVISVTKKYSDLENGYYEQSEKIVKMCIAVIGALGTIMIPRNSKLFADNKTDKLKENFYFATNYVWVLGSPMMFGLASLAPNMVPWFFGENYGKCILLIQLFTPLVMFIGMSNVFGLQYLIPTKRDAKFTLGILAGTISNLILNCALIPFYWSYGAVIASLIAEFLVSFTMFMFIRKEVSFLLIAKQSVKPLSSGLIMFGVVYLTQSYLASTWYFSVCLILEGVAVYFLSMLFMKDSFVLGLLSKLKHTKKQR